MCHKQLDFGSVFNLDVIADFEGGDITSDGGGLLLKEIDLRYRITQTAAAFFAAVHLGMKAKLEILALHVMDAAGRIFGIPNFRYYALADGIREILTKASRGIRNRESPPTHGLTQMTLFSP